MNTNTNSDYYVVRAGGCGHLVRLVKQPLPATGLAEMQASGLCASCYRDADTGQLVLADQPLPAGVSRRTVQITPAQFQAEQAALAMEATQPEPVAISGLETSMDYRLAEPVQATLIHGVTGREVEDQVLPAGTPYKFEGEPLSTGVTYILVPGQDAPDLLYLYRVATADLNGALA